MSTAPSHALLLLVATAFGCSEGTGGDWEKVAPSYSWQGKVVDAVSGAPLAHPAFRVAESPVHEANDWAPFVGVQLTSGGEFLVEYSLNGINCDPPRDTVFALTLQVSDSLDQHQSLAHPSQWQFHCSTVRPDSVIPLPFPVEKDLDLRLEPRPQ
jgi:hypothetical protein